MTIHFDPDIGKVKMTEKVLVEIDDYHEMFPVCYYHRVEKKIADHRACVEVDLETFEKWKGISEAWGELQDHLQSLHDQYFEDLRDKAK